MVYDRAMEILTGPQARFSYLAVRRLARSTLRRLATQYGRTWNNRPASNYLNNTNYGSEPEGNIHYNPGPRVYRHRTLQEMLERYHPNQANPVPRSAGPSTNLSVINVNRPNQLVDPISLKNASNWPANRMAVRLAPQTKLANGRPNVNRAIYMTQNSFNRWFGRRWRTMLQNSTDEISNKFHPTFRGKVQRWQVQLVKFKEPNSPTKRKASPNKRSPPKRPRTRSQNR